MDNQQFEIRNLAANDDLCEIEDSLIQHGLYRLNTLLPHLPIGRTRWFNLMRAGQAPKPVVSIGRAVAWRGADILSWLENPATWAERNRLKA